MPKGTQLTNGRTKMGPQVSGQMTSFYPLGVTEREGLAPRKTLKA